MKPTRVHPTGPKPKRTLAARDLDGNGNGSRNPISQKRLRRLPHLFGNILELPFRSDANVSVEELPDFFKFVAVVGDLGSDCVTAHALEIIPGVIKIVVRDDDEETEGVELFMDKLEMDAWRFRFPSSTQPEMVAAEYVDGELIVTVPKGWELEDGGDPWSSSRLVLVR